MTKLWKRPARLLAILSFFILSACGTVPIYDAEFCGDLGRDGATCFRVLSKTRRNISKADWDHVTYDPKAPRDPDERFGMICTVPESFTDQKSAIEKLCRMSKRCIYKKEINSFFENLEAVKAQKPK